MQFADGKVIKFYLRCPLIHKYMAFILSRILSSFNNSDLQCEVYLCIVICVLVFQGTLNFYTCVYHFQLYYLRLPKDIKDYKVILMDATVATGAAAMMAIRVLLDHDVPEENILIVSLLMAEIGK